MGEDKIIALSEMTSKPELLAQLLAQIKAPVSGFVNVLSGSLKSLVYALNAIKESKN